MNKFVGFGRYQEVKAKDYLHKGIEYKTKYKDEEKTTFIPMYFPPEISLPEKGEFIFVDGQVYATTNHMIGIRVISWQSSKNRSIRRHINAKSTEDEFDSK